MFSAVMNHSEASREDYLSIGPSTHSYSSIPGNKGKYIKKTTSEMSRIMNDCFEIKLDETYNLPDLK